MRTFLLILSVLLLLTGCGMFQKRAVEPEIGDVNYVPVWRTYDCGAEPEITVPTMLDIFIQVQGKTGLYTMDGQEYGDSAENMADTILGLKHQRAVIRFYRKCIAEALRLAVKDNPP